MGKRILICLLLLAGTVYAQPSDRLDSLRLRVYNKAGLSESGTSLIPTATVNSYLNSAAWRVAKDFPAVMKYDTVHLSPLEVDYSDTLSARFMRPKHARNYFALPSSTERPGGDTGFVILTFVEDEAAFRAMGGQIGASRVLDGIGPTYYTIVNKTVSVLPAPGLSDTLFIAYYGEPTYMSAASTRCGVSPEYLWLVEALAVVDICNRMGDYSRAATYETAYQREWAKFNAENE